MTFTELATFERWEDMDTFRADKWPDSVVSISGMRSGRACLAPASQPVQDFSERRQPVQCAYSKFSEGEHSDGVS